MRSRPHASLFCSRLTALMRPRRSSSGGMLLHLLTAGFGTSRTSGNVRLESGKWAKADTLTISAGHPASALKIRVTIKGSQRLGPCSQHAKIKPAVETLARFLKSGRPPACSKSLAKRGPVEPADACSISEITPCRSLGEPGRQRPRARRSAQAR
jgi:hypothetical protein